MPKYRLVLGIDDYDFYSIVSAMRCFLRVAPIRKDHGETARFTAVPDEGYSW